MRTSDGWDEDNIETFYRRPATDISDGDIWRYRALTYVWRELRAEASK